MIRIIDTLAHIPSAFDGGQFSLDKWKVYMESAYGGCVQMLTDDLEDCLRNGGYAYETDILPILNDACGHPASEALHESFRRATDGLHQRVCDLFGRELDVDIVLYLGLCNGAGWVTSVNGRDVILLGVEKILELNWCDEDAMRGLIYHELGHVYHMQHGAFRQSSEDTERNFVWQLFTEGIAMYFEQALVGDFSYYHQDKDGWLSWCEAHTAQIAADFHSDLPAMLPSNQRYFGDWVRYHGRGDVGYYLGARFVHWLADTCEFDRLIRMDVNEVYGAYLSFIGTLSS